MKIPVSTITYKNFNLEILRLDKMGDEIQGNKFFKLKYNVEEVLRKNFSTLLTFGGAYSNHIFATAAAGHQYGVKTIGVIRGEDDPQNPTLKFARDHGMQLHFISRKDYEKRETEAFIDNMKMLYGDFYLLPEGGTNRLAVKGCSEILNDRQSKYDHIMLACGTGGTIAGIICTAGVTSEILGISVLKGKDQLTEKIKRLTFGYSGKHFANWKINSEYHLGGYAKYNSSLVEFIKSFRSRFNIILDPIYTGKMMFAVFDLIDKNYFNPGEKILCIHTGGLQGIAGWEQRFGKIF